MQWHVRSQKVRPGAFQTVATRRKPTLTPKVPSSCVAPSMARQMSSDPNDATSSSVGSHSLRLGGNSPSAARFDGASPPSGSVRGAAAPGRIGGFQAPAMPGGSVDAPGPVGSTGGSTP